MTRPFRFQLEARFFSIGVSLLSLVYTSGCLGLTSRASPGSPPPGAVQITTTSMPAATTNTFYSQTLLATGGTSPYTWSISSGSLPTGLALTASTGAIAGTPTFAGTFSFLAKATDSAGLAATQSLSITVATAALPLSITTNSAPDGQTNTIYSAFLSAAGGISPYAWAVSSGSLPAGLTLRSSGEISGVPASTGTSSFEVMVTDSSSPANTTTANFGITITQGATYSVALTWTASPSTGVIGYNVYRSTVSGNNYQKIASTGVTSLSYTDGAILDHTTYYYVLTAFDNGGNESGYSTEVQIVIP
jgi:hypothetical protein